MHSRDSGAISKVLVTSSFVCILVCGLFGCAGGSSTTKSSNVVSSSSTSISSRQSISTDTSDTIVEQSKTSASSSTAKRIDAIDDLISQMSECYIGTTQAGETIYYAGDDKNAILVYADPSTSRYALFLGPVTANSDTTITVTDTETGVYMNFGVEQNLDKSISLDMGDELGKAKLYSSTKREMSDALNEIVLKGTCVNH